jgi:NAD(P)-dependent dehydrogenase (short-subunit alcohol dehydrogenase family)
VRFQNKVCVVTGAASGIGYAIARALADEGGKVAALDLKPAQIGTYFRCDLGEDDHIDRVKTLVDTALGPADIVVHAAAISHNGALLDSRSADFLNILNVNTYGAVRLAKAFAPAMQLRKSGAFVFISSINANFSTPNMGLYAASKAALDSLTKTLGFELAPENVRVNSIQPASIDTPLLLDGFRGKTDADAAMQKNRARHPLARWGRPDEVAKLALFLASDDAAWITGSHYAIDGGASITRQ